MSKNFTKHKNATHKFTMIPKAVSFDQDLSLKGFGLLIKLLILSEVEDWEFSEMGLVKSTGWGRTIIRSALRELEELGYLVRTQDREGGGRFAKVEWHIFESPVKVAQSGEVTELQLDLPNAFEMPNFSDKQVISSTAPESGAPMSENRTSGAQTSVHRTQYNTITIKDFNDIKHNNLQCGAGAPGAGSTEEGLYNETGGLGEALAESSPSVSTNPPVPAQSTTALSETDRVLKQLKKKYKSAFVEYALELSKDKDDSIAYMKSVLRDWKKQNLKSIQEVQRYVSSFEDEKTPDLTIKSFATGKAIRVEQTPSWLHQEQKQYDANRQLTVEEQQAVDRMKSMQSELLDQYAANLPF